MFAPLERTQQKAVAVLNAGGVIMRRTDTLYGLLARADDLAAVQKVYSLKGRHVKKPCIILISSIDMLYDVSATGLNDFLNSIWPGPVSVIIPAPSAPAWLLRDGETLAYRLPGDPELLDLISQTGPLIAPSANPEGLPPARDVEEAKKYFGREIELYEDGGTVPDVVQPSQLWQFSVNGAPERLR